MVIPRKYSVNEVRELVEIFANDPDTSREKYAGMTAVLHMLEHFEQMSDADIEDEVRTEYKRISTTEILNTK